MIFLHFYVPFNGLKIIIKLLLGILGREIVRALAKDPKQWQTVHALSRSQKETYPSNVQHDFIDLTSDAKKMAQQLRGVEADYIFFAAYLQKDTEQENWDVNGAPADCVYAFVAFTKAI